MSSSYGISNAMILLVLILLVHGLLLKRPVTASPRQSASEHYSTLPAEFTGAVPHSPIGTNSFQDAFVSQPPPGRDSMQEMIEFANSNESWASCDMTLSDTSAEVPGLQQSPCLRQEATMTNRALVNTFEDDDVSNGAEIERGLRGFEDWSTMHARV